MNIDSTKDSLIHIIHACLSDLETKLKSLVYAGEGSDDFEIQRVRDFISKLTEESAVIEIEEVLPKILEYLHRSKQEQGCVMMKQAVERQRDRIIRAAWSGIVNVAV